MSALNPKADFFFNKAKSWKEEYEYLRKLMLDSPMVEEVKWGVPCYTFQNTNVVLIHGFKEYCALLFHKGVLLKDPKKILIQQTANVQAGRQIRFKNLEEIIKLEKVIKAYVKEAIEIEKSGQKVVFKTTQEYTMPEEFKLKLTEDPHLKKCFDALTPGRQRAYLYFFGQPKLSKTREERVKKYIPNILNGKGIED